MILDIVGPQCKPTELIALNVNEKMPSIVAKTVTLGIRLGFY